MIVDLVDASFATADEEAVLRQSGVTLSHRRGVSPEDLAWVRRVFNTTWAMEARAGWNWIAKDANGATVGFASYEQRRFRWWWIRRWLEQPDIGIFGPMGVAPELRGKGIGCVLARHALASIKALGFEHALIPRVGPIEFYKRCCDARIVEQIKFLGVF